MQNRRRRCGLHVHLTVFAGFAVSFAFAQTPPTATEPETSTDVAQQEVPQQETRPDVAPQVDVPEEPADEKPPSPKEVCIDEAESRAVIDRVRSSLYKITCSSATWFDGLFGNSRYVEQYRTTSGSVTVGTVWSERESFEEVLRFRVRVTFPQMNQRLHAFVGRVDREDFITESKADVYGLPSEFNRDASEETLVGIGYNEPLKKRGSFDLSTGIRVTFPLDPYVKGSYRFARPIGERDLMRLRETAFWQNSEEFGVTSRIDWDHVIGDRDLVRYTASGTFSQVSEGTRWFTNLTFFHFINTDRALAYELGANGSTDREVPLTDYGGSVVLRQRLPREWLLLELRVGVDWPRDWLYEKRHYNINAGVAIELRFGRGSSEDETPVSEKPAAN